MTRTPFTVAKEKFINAQRQLDHHSVFFGENCQVNWLFYVTFLALSLAFLVKEGYEDRILVAHDIHTKDRLVKFGGHGYSHILKNIVPKMLRRNISQHQVDKILIDNPKHWLTFK